MPVRIWLAFLPSALIPSWQLTQLPVMPVCVKFAGVHAVVVWQVSHDCVVGMWFVPLPVAMVPLWQEAQVPVTCV